MIPILVGVAGHRRMGAASVAYARGVVHREIRHLQSLLPTTPIVIVSALAEGADRLVARVALECNCILWAVLPTSPLEYVKDFESEASREEFKFFLGRSSRIVNASLDAGHSQNFAIRPQIYLNVAHQICRMSHMLIALWDGDMDEATGGTSQVVRMFRNGEFPGSNPSQIAYPDCGPVLHVPVSRDDVSAGSKRIRWLGASPGRSDKPLFAGQLGAVRRDFDRSIARLEAFNAQCINVDRSPEAVACQMLPTSFPWRNDPLLVEWLNWFSAAEAVSNSYGKLRRRNLMLVILFFVMFTLATLAYGGLVMEAWPLFLGILAFSAAVVGYARHRAKDIEELWVGSRVVAECLRVAIIQRSANFQLSVHHVAAEEGVFPFDWIGMAVRSIDMARIGQPAPLDIGANDLNSIITFWCDSQQNYFVDGTNKIAHHARSALRYSRISAGCVIAALLVYLFTAGFDLQFSAGQRNEAMAVTAWTMYAYWGLLSIGAVVSSFSLILGHADHKVDYQFALIKFRMVDQHMKMHPGRLSPEIATQLGRAALREVLAWLKLHRGRPLRLPF